MIQRIQTVWLALAACCMALCFINPAARYSLQNEAINQTIHAQLDLLPKDNPEMLDQMAAMKADVDFGQKTAQFNTWPLIALAVAVIAVAVVCIFLYKNRVRQARIVMIGFVLNLVYVFLLYFWAVDGYANAVKAYLHMSDIKKSWTLGAYAPIASLLLLFLAQLAIRKDEAKVRAADRLR